MFLGVRALLAVFTFAREAALLRLIVLFLFQLDVHFLAYVLNWSCQLISCLLVGKGCPNVLATLCSPIVVLKDVLVAVLVEATQVHCDVAFAFLIIILVRPVDAFAEI